jgi:hypothetical protein
MTKAGNVALTPAKYSLVFSFGLESCELNKTCIARAWNDSTAAPKCYWSAWFHLAQPFLKSWSACSLSLASYLVNSLHYVLCDPKLLPSAQKYASRHLYWIRHESSLHPHQVQLHIGVPPLATQSLKRPVTFAMHSSPPPPCCMVRLITTKVLCGKVKVSFTLQQATKANRWSRGVGVYTISTLEEGEWFFWPYDQTGSVYKLKCKTHNYE